MLLETTALTKRFGGVIAVNAVDLAIAEGRVFGLIGPNGAGKTTLINLISGHFRADGKMLALAGQDRKAWVIDLETDGKTDVVIPTLREPCVALHPSEPLLAVGSYFDQTHTVLLLSTRSGQTVNIPHVLATYYDNAGRVIWVSDGYVDHALVPQTPLPFAVELRDDLASKVQTYRVTVNHYSLDRQ